MKTRSTEYHLTILNSRSLISRLSSEIRFTIDRLELLWPDFKRDPIGFGKLGLVALASLVKERVRGPALASALTALSVVISAVLFITMMDGLGSRKPTAESESMLVEMLSFPDSGQSSLSGEGVGAGSNGRVGFNRGKGEGSNPQPKKAGGGGSGGMKNKTEAQQGKVPPPSEIPAMIPQLPPPRKQALPVAGIDIDPLLWKNMEFSKYGDPRSSSTTNSNGTGEGGGMGNRTGTGVGDGSGDGFGPGSDGNMGDGPRGIGGPGPGGSSGNNPHFNPDSVFTASKVEQRARVISKPEPQYTDEARRNQIIGTVVLRAVFSRSGDVINIRAVQALPFGLTEKAIAAARQIRFVPAVKDGRPVSVYIQLEYNFNLY